MSVVERIAPAAFIRALINDADIRPITASAKRRHPTTRRTRVVKEVTSPIGALRRKNLRSRCDTCRLGLVD
jgi:hypothetical protein